MKKLIVSAAALLCAASLAAAEPQWSASLFMGAGKSGGDGMGGLGVAVQREFGDYFEAGFHLYAQAEVDQEYSDGSGRGYHMSSGFSTLVLSPKIGLGQRFELALPLETGSGILQYRYDGEYREELTWTEEILDQVTHSVYSIGIEPRLLFGENGALVATFGYRVTGPLRTTLAESGELDGFWGRAGYSWRF